MSRPELELERALSDLGAHLDFPATPDLALAVATRLREAPAARPREPRVRGWLARLPRLPGWRRLALAGLAAVLLAAAVLVVSPGTREAVARRLGLRGIDIRIGGERPTVTTRPGERLELGLGLRVTLEEARRRVAFPVLVPTAAGFQRRRDHRRADPAGRQHPRLAGGRADAAPGGPALQAGGPAHRRVDALGAPARKLLQRA